MTHLKPFIRLNGGTTHIWKSISLFSMLLWVNYWNFFSAQLLYMHGGRGHFYLWWYQKFLIHIFVFSNKSPWRGHWSVYYTSLQSLIIMFSYSMAYQLWGLLSNLDWVVQTRSVQIFINTILFYRRMNINLSTIVVSLKIQAFICWSFRGKDSFLEGGGGYVVLALVSLKYFPNILNIGNSIKSFYECIYFDVKRNLKDMVLGFSHLTIS